MSNGPFSASPEESRAVWAANLTKSFRVPQKEPGLKGALGALFSRRFRDIVAVDAIGFEIRPGELVGFLGANGAGKTTTLKMLSGLLYPTSGEVRVLGFVPGQRRPEFQKRMTLVMGQRSQLWWEIPAQETFRLNKEIYEIPDKAYAETLAELVELLDLSSCLDIPVKRLSLGQRMRAELCASLLHRPALMLLDEPTLGLDVVMQKKVREFVRHYNRRFNATVLLTSHNMDDVVELCERILIIDHGRLIYDGDLKDVVRRYATHKLICVDFESPVEPSALESIGRVLTNGGNRAQIEVARRDISAAASRLLGRFPVQDLTITETPVEEIVRRIFAPSH